MVVVGPGEYGRAVNASAVGVGTVSEDESSDSDDDDVNVELVDSSERCRTVCDEWLRSVDAVAIDIEGVNLGRDGEICIVQVANRTRKVILFDVTAMGSCAFTSGLKDLLEAEGIAKLFFDCRGDADALFHLHGVTPRHVLDMQVLCHKAKGGQGAFLVGITKALADVLPYVKRQVMKGIKETGLRLFAPERGGSFDVWKMRPLPDVLISYCVQDIVHLFTVFDRWRDCMAIETLRTISEGRMKKHISRAAVERGPELARRDFEYPEESSIDQSALEPATKRLRTTD
eukprot:TRINITY_DN42351_c0_g1_i1.p1 TRINITY_DN42351_c0_g1~~TRINITY_DN42351_c0_g1_i1.p1  ORF type:complete len:298 (-),score=34.34 TRINITY_DN42351_c0_g1_i1:57-917(-)